ncbi:unnamed protein product [Cylicocyclus nassatus]|uniref:Prefoldin subunit alpha n=1 Tax=Cylicocyclus nassatus TaxID=53992 RepID=A0AA36GZ96_CYLNA|nr:unnamed protein product [Cylicocyclus nassatus]
MTQQEDEKIERFRSIVSGQLQDELAKLGKDRQQILVELQDYAALLVVVRNLQMKKSSKVNIRTSLGHQVFVNAELEKQDSVIVKLAGDLFAELKLERAEIFITQKLEILRKKAELSLELASKTKATIKFLLAAIGEYDKLAAKR